jgi:hypothetical protein
VDDWKRTTVYDGGYDAASPMMVWFWEIVEKMDDSERSALLHFCTGSSRMPAGGFARVSVLHARSLAFNFVAQLKNGVF